MKYAAAFLSLTLFATISFAQATEKSRFSWEWQGTSCTKALSFCWYGAEAVGDPELMAYGDRWVSKDTSEKPFEWVTEVRCVKSLQLCILARNQKLTFTGKTHTNIDLYYVEEWSDFQVRAVEESDFPKGKECEIDSLLINRAEASVSMLSVPGPVATDKRCTAVMTPKTVMYTLELDSVP